MRKVTVLYECDGCGWRIGKEFIDLVWWTVRKIVPPEPISCSFCGADMKLIEREDNEV